MKRFFGLAMVMISLAVLLSGAKEKDFEGTITYKITYLEVPKEIEGMESMLPQETTMSFKGSKVAIQQSVMGGSQTVIADSKDSTSFILMDMMGQKIAVVVTKEEMREAAKNAVEPIIQKLDGTKKILNYKCQKAVITVDGNKTTLFYTKKLGIKHNQFGSLDGFPLEYETSAQGMKLNMTATAGGIL